MPNQVNVQKKEVSNDKRLLMLTGLCLMFLSAGFLLDSLDNIVSGMKNILLHRSNLLTDYIALGGIGAAFVNAGLTTLLAVFVVFVSKANVSGPVMAAVFTVAGFSFLGKNVYNCVPVYLGVWLYTRSIGVSYKNSILAALFGTGLAPAVNQVSFGFGFSPVMGILGGCALGLMIGFMMQPIASRVSSLHNGFSLYNVGLAAGLIGLAAASVMRLFGLDLSYKSILSSGYHSVTVTFLLVLLTVMYALGFWINGANMRNYGELLKNPGRSADFINLYGYGLALMNMALVGYIVTFYVVLTGAQMDGVVMGSVFMAIGFGAFGKHPRNIIPILAGVYFASLIGVYETKASGVAIAAVFGTALAPVAGEYGVLAGILAGILHLSVVMNTGYLHGGMNLYNNGFSTGLVAGILSPILEMLKSNVKKKGTDN